MGTLKLIEFKRGALIQVPEQLALERGVAQPGAGWGAD